ncbi:uncharacterized protein LOC127130688 [Lathyrus oleraceus]|uniref:uncharacterized protein LOC127130688 n=1 Tax=Pisum sativum TaxID=3888 RepID=UPI0021D0CB59|nr:uncharacterized protein LOC127130688 [Pisum sativum]
MGQGEMLMQNIRVMADACRKLKVHERNYPTHDLELGVIGRWLKFLKDSDFGLSYHPGKSNVVIDALSRKSLHMSMLMVGELEMIEQFRDLSLVCEMTRNSVKLGILKMTSGILEEIREDVSKLKKSILKEGHRSGLSIHLGATKMYQDMKKLFWWPRMKKETVEFALTKLAHFILIQLNYPLERLIELYIEKIVSLHGIPLSIISDRDLRFTSRFWESLQKALGMKLRLRFAYHPHIDDHIKRIIQSLKDLLRDCVLEQGGSWDNFLPLTEFTYNNSFYSSIGMVPFEALCGKRCTTSLCWYESGEGVVIGLEIVNRP